MAGVVAATAMRRGRSGWRARQRRVAGRASSEALSRWRQVVVVAGAGRRASAPRLIQAVAAPATLRATMIAAAQQAQAGVAEERRSRTAASVALSSARPGSSAARRGWRGCAVPFHTPMVVPTHTCSGNADRRRSRSPARSRRRRATRWRSPSARCRRTTTACRPRPLPGLAERAEVDRAVRAAPRLAGRRRWLEVDGELGPGRGITDRAVGLVPSLFGLTVRSRMVCTVQVPGPLMTSLPALRAAAQLAFAQHPGHPLPCQRAISVMMGWLKARGRGCWPAAGGAAGQRHPARSRSPEYHSREPLMITCVKRRRSAWRAGRSASPARA